MAQLKRVLNRLKRGSLTQAQALRELGVARLGARIYDLREKGYLIHSENVIVRNRFGDECRVARYTLKGSV